MTLQFVSSTTDEHDPRRLLIASTDFRTGERPGKVGLLPTQHDYTYPTAVGYIACLQRLRQCYPRSTYAAIDDLLYQIQENFDQNKVLLVVLLEKEC